MAFAKQRRKYSQKINTKRNSKLRYIETLKLYQQVHRFGVQEAKESVIKIHHSFNRFISKFLLEILTLSADEKNRISKMSLVLHQSIFIPYSVHTYISINVN